MRGYHFFQRTDRHQELLEGREAELKRLLKKAIGTTARIRIEPSHFHVFASVSNPRAFSRRIKKEISKLDVRWDTEHYMIPISSISKEYVDQLIKDLHKQHFL